MAISKRTRYEVLRRDNYTCRYCRSTDNTLRIDHVIPVALGGTDNPDNLVAACIDCNAGKSSISPDQAQVAAVNEDALRWGAAMKQALANHSLKIAAHEKYSDDFLEYWSKWHGPGDKPLPLPDDWRNSLIRWNELGVTSDHLQYATHRAMDKPNLLNTEVFRYFAGVIWRMLDEVEREATGLVRDTPPPANHVDLGTMTICYAIEGSYHNDIQTLAWSG
jgi:hypothetical protein